MPVATEPFLPKKETYVPTDGDLFQIQFADGSFNSCLKTHQVGLHTPSLPHKLPSCHCSVTEARMKLSTSLDCVDSISSRWTLDRLRAELVGSRGLRAEWVAPRVIRTVVGNSPATPDLGRQLILAGPHNSEGIIASQRTDSCAISPLVVVHGRECTHPNHSYDLGFDPPLLVGPSRAVPAPPRLRCWPRRLARTRPHRTKQRPPLCEPLL